MEEFDMDAVVAALELEKAKDSRAAGDLIKDYPDAYQTEIAERLGYAVGMTRAGRSFRLINPRKTRVEGTAGIILDHNGDQTKVLMQERWNSGNCWEPCGGGLRNDETAEDNVVREAFEETGLVTEITDSVGVFAKPTDEEILRYTDGEERHCVVNIFTLGVTGGALTLNDEVTDLKWFYVDEVMNLKMLPVHRRIMEIALMPPVNRPYDL